MTKRALAIGAGTLMISAAAGAAMWERERSHRLEARPPGIDRTEPISQVNEFSFVRLIYQGGSWGYKFWGTDFPHAERHLMTSIRRLTNLRVSLSEQPIRIGDPRLFQYPFLYAVEAAQMDLSDQEALALRDHLLRGGFLVVDDFWGSEQWRRFEAQIARVFPDRRIFEIPMDHELFHCFYNITEIVQVPAYGRYYGGGTHEEDGYTARCLGIADDDGRLMVVINWNTDLGDAWEWVDRPEYPSQYSTPALKLGVNMVIYAMSH